MPPPLVALLLLAGAVFSALPGAQCAQREAAVFAPPSLAKPPPPLACPSVCPAGTRCVGHACMADDLASHLARSAFGQEAALWGQPAELTNCSLDPLEDAAQGRVLCDVYHAVAAARPGVLHELGNTWMTFTADASDPCRVSPATWRNCTAQWLRAVAARFRSVAPDLLFSGGLMEFLAVQNLDDPSQFQAACVPGSLGQWGPNTCVPNIAGSSVAREYYVQMGQAFLDGGCTLLFFGQARLTGGGVDGSSAVSEAGAEGFLQVITSLRAYAAQQGYGPVYFGAQAACCVQTAGGPGLIDFVYGAQHLQPLTASAPWLVQPLLRRGPFFPAAPSQPPWAWPYGPDDWHDANLVNNMNGIPVLLDWDNWSGDPTIPDDIRTLACLASSADRAQALSDKFFHLNNYNAHAFMSVPFSKVMASLSAPAPFGEAKCWGNATSTHPAYFSANACGVVGMAARLFALPYNPGKDK